MMYGLLYNISARFVKEISENGARILPTAAHNPRLIPTQEQIHCARLSFLL
jgi:hypothetical protein